MVSDVSLDSVIWRATMDWVDGDVLEEGVKVGSID